MPNWPNCKASMRVVRRGQRGYLLSYVLLSMVLMSMLLSYMARVNRNADAGKRRDELVAEIQGQIDLIRTKLMACAINFPAGDNGTGIRTVYPAKPVSGAVADLVCPGAPLALKPLWAGKDGVYYPRLVPGAGAWQYENDATSLRVFMTPVDSTGPMGAAINLIVSRNTPQASFSAGQLSIVLVN